MSAFDFKPFAEGGEPPKKKNGGWSEEEALAWEKGYYNAERGLAPDLHHVPDFCQRAYKAGWEAGRKA